jgi:predicted amidohydrolase
MLTKMNVIEPYNVVGLIPTVWGISKRQDIMVNIEHHRHMIKAACWLTGLDIPVRLIALPEGALQGFNDEIKDSSHVEYARQCAIDIPGPETDALADIAREYSVYIIAQAKARHPEIKDRFFNVGFILSPEGELILKHYKVAPLYPVEHSVCPHDIYDWWIERYGRTLDAFWPVADTDIGRIGIMMANEGSYPEHARGLAMNGAELVYRAGCPHPAASNEYFEIQNRARALDNNMYVIAPNLGTYYIDTDSEAPIDTFGGSSMIVDHRGQIVGRQSYGGVSTWVCGPVNIEVLRHQRVNSQWTNWIKDLRTEMIQIIYEQAIYPKNLYAEREPMKHSEYKKKVIDQQITLMIDRGVWKDHRVK